MMILSVAHSKSDNVKDAISSALLGALSSVNEQPECRAVLAAISRVATQRQRIYFAQERHCSTENTGRQTDGMGWGL